MNVEINSVESFGKLISGYIKDKFGVAPSDPTTPPAVLISHNSWGQFIEFDDEGWVLLLVFRFLNSNHIIPPPATEIFPFQIFSIILFILILLIISCYI